MIRCTLHTVFHGYNAAPVRI